MLESCRGRQKISGQTAVKGRTRATA